MVIRRFAAAALLALVFGAGVHAQTITYYQLPAGTGGIVTGPDGNLWYASGDAIVKLTTAGQATSYPSPVPIGVTAVVFGSDGRLWFIAGQHAIGAMTTSGVFTIYPVPGPPFSRGVALGSDGNIWFGYYEGVGRITPTGTVTLFPIAVPGNTQPIQVRDLVRGPDGNIWFIPGMMTWIGRITPAGAHTLFPTGSLGWPSGLGLSSDGQVWAAFLSHRVVLMNMNGTIGPQFATGGTSTFNEPVDVAAGFDARIWFWEAFSGRLGRVRENGEIAFVNFDPNIALVRGMTMGPDGAVWAVVEEQRVRCDGPGCPTLPPQITIARVHLGESIPTLGPISLTILTMTIAAMAVVAMRRV